MCGIAGWNISPEVAGRLDTLKVFDAIEEMTLLNIHRGGDAFGWMMQYSEPVNDHSSYWYKNAGDGRNIKSKVIECWSDWELNDNIPNVLGVHTRAKSSGFPETRVENNHPVEFGTVLTTHNGMIRNHYEIKQMAKEKVPTGVVDSIAISASLDLIENIETDYETLGDILPRYEGGWAFHSVWTQTPGYSLLVAGPRYPLVLWSKKGVLAYSSEFEAIDSAFNVLGEKFPKSREPLKLKPGNFVIVKDGEPVHFGQYDLERKEYNKRFPKYGYHTTSDNRYKRWIPVLKKWIDGNQYRGSVTGAATGERIHTSVDHTWEQDRFALIYKKDEGIVNADALERLAITANYSKPLTKIVNGDTIEALAKWKSCFELLVEADRIYLGKGKGQNTFYVYGMLGATEVVLSDTGSVVGIYNWKDGLDRPTYLTTWELQQEEKNKKLEKETSYKGITLSNEKFMPWLRQNSISPKTALNGEKIVGSCEPDTKECGTGKEESQTFLPTMITGGGGFNKRLDDADDLYAFSDDLSEWMQPIEADEAVKFLTFHMNPHTNIPILWNEKCGTHDEMIETHSDPLKCHIVLLASAIACSWLNGIDAWLNVFPAQLPLVYDRFNISGDYKPCYKGVHKWEVSEVRVYPVGEQYMEIIEAEVCDDCGLRRTISKYPAVIEAFDKEYRSAEVV